MTPTTYIDHQCATILQREQVHYEVNESEEPVWYDMPNSVYAAYEDAMLIERY